MRSRNLVKWKLYFLKNLLRKFCGARVGAPDATHCMRFTNETLHFVVLLAVPIRDRRTDG
jgi:hypothetical protein